jgi:hypothetical protein
MESLEEEDDERCVLVLKDGQKITLTIQIQEAILDLPR